MSVFYVPPKDQTLNLSNKGTEVVTGLTEDKSKLDSAVETTQTPIGVARSSVSVHQVPSRELDLELLSAVNSTIQSINAKKEQLVELTSIPLKSYIPGISQPSCELQSDPSSMSSNSISETESEFDAVNPIISSRTGNSGVNTPSIASATVRKDELRVWRAPYLEEQRAPNNKAFEGLKYPVLNVGIAGQGQENIIFENGKYTDPESGVSVYTWNTAGDWSNVTWEETGETVGKYYNITGPGSGVIKMAGDLNYSTETFIPEPEWKSLVDVIVGLATTTNGIVTSGSFYPISNGVGAAATHSVSFNPSTGQMKLLDLYGDPIDVTDFMALSYTGPGIFTMPSVDICEALQQSVATLESEITSLRSELSGYASLDSANVVKGKKHAEQLKVWSLKRVEVREQEQSTQSGIGTGAVIAIDANIPNSPDTFDSSTIKFDSSTITFDSFDK